MASHTETQVAPATARNGFDMRYKVLNVASDDTLELRCVDCGGAVPIGYSTQGETSFLCIDCEGCREWEEQEQEQEHEEECKCAVCGYEEDGYVLNGKSLCIGCYDDAMRIIEKESSDTEEDDSY